MRKPVALLCLVIIVFLSGCSNIGNKKEPESSNSVSNTEASTDSQDGVELETGVYWYKKYWDTETAGVMSLEGVKTEKRYIPDMDTALQIANSIMKKTGYDMNKFKPYQVFFDVKDKMWIIGYHIPNNDPNIITLGGGINIALKQSNSEIIRMWGDE